MNERDEIIEIMNKCFAETEIIPEFVSDNGKKTLLPQGLCKIFDDIMLQVIPYFADALLANGIGDVSKWKRQAEVAEAAREEFKHCVDVIGKRLDNATSLANKILQQSERKIEEESK